MGGLCMTKWLGLCWTALIGYVGLVSSDSLDWMNGVCLTKWLGYVRRGVVDLMMGNVWLND